MQELIVDSFAGGGGASEGIRAAIGRDPDIAINHDRLALAMHRVNHPGTHHIAEDVWHIDPVSMCAGRSIGLLWMSPDCKHFSKAKGGKPREKAIRGLAWVGLRWVKALPKWQRPRVIILENVEEFQDWGPLLGNGLPCPVQKGATFKQYIGAYGAMGYVADWRELRACDYGDPTIRKRLFVILRCDGEPIVWPEPTHGDPNSEAVRSGRLKPWRTAAEIIDWSLPCPSIFDTSEEIRRIYGIKAKRPLVDATLARIAKGVVRYVIQSARPFIVPVTHAGDTRVHAADEPLRTITTAKRGELAVVTPFLARTAHGEIDRNGKRRGSGQHDVQAPIPTITASPDFAMAAVHLSRQFGASIGSAADEPVGTITAGGGGKAAVVAAFLAQHNTGLVGHDAREPVSTIVQAGSTQGIVAAHLTHLYGSNKAAGGGDPTKPLKTDTAGGRHAGVVAAFLAKYYGAGEPVQGADEPLHTVTTKPRHGLVTVSIEGEPYTITDIGMRMLTPRERFNAQGFRPDYIIDYGLLEDGSVVELTGEQQGRMCGNSVCPGVAKALAAANYRPRTVSRIPLRAAAQPDLLTALGA